MIKLISRSTGVPTKYIWVSVATMLFWIAAVVASGAGWNPLGIRWRFENPGAFGDAFGPLSAVMASIAALSAIAAFRSQVQQYTGDLERRELDDEIAASERERLAAREAAADARTEKLNFETTFFNLLEAFRAIVADVDLRTRKGTTATAHDAFRIMCNYYEARIAYDEETPERAWQLTADEYKNDLNHYFRFMYHVVKFVDDSSIKEKYFYVRLIRASLSESELKLLALNAQFGEGREKFKGLIERYALLHNLDERVIAGVDLSALYDPSAFEQTTHARPIPRRTRKAGGAAAPPEGPSS
jgi:putative phage abortive infection protein